MSNWFVYDNDGMKKGPVTSAQLKSLANSGKINPNTIIESENGHKGRAGLIKELFTSERPLESSLSENEVVPENQNKTDSDMTSKGSQEKTADNQQNSSENSKKSDDTVEHSFLFNSFCKRHESALAITERMFNAYLGGCFLLLIAAVLYFINGQIYLGIVFVISSISCFVTTILVHELIRLAFCFMATMVFSNEDILQNQIQLNRYFKKQN